MAELQPAVDQEVLQRISEVVIVADDDCKGVIEPMLSGERLLLSPVHHNGYIQQQIIKCNAWVYVNNPEQSSMWILM